MYAGLYNSTRNQDTIQGTIGSTGAFSGSVGPVPQGFCWYVERIGCRSNTASTSGVLSVLVTDSGDVSSETNVLRGLMDVATGTVIQAGVSDEASPIYLGPGQFLVASWTGLTNGDLVGVALQIRVHQLIGTASRGGYPSQWTGREGYNGDAGHYVIVGDQIAES